MIRFSKFLLLEKHSEVYYHDTNYEALDNILHDDKFLLKSSYFKNAEDRPNINSFKYPYFMSLSRNPANSYRSYPSVTLVLNGRKLNSNFKILPIDYWGQGFKKLGTSEMEERLLSRSSTIKNATKYIDEVHIYVDNDYLSGKKELPSVINRLSYYGDKFKIYYYNNRKFMISLRKDKSVDLPKELKVDYTHKQYERNLDKFSEFLDFLETGKTRNYYGEWLNYSRDFIPACEAEIHNFYSLPSSHYWRTLTERLINMMRSEKTTNPRDFLIKKLSKFKDIPEDQIRKFYLR